MLWGSLYHVRLFHTFIVCDVIVMGRLEAMDSSELLNVLCTRINGSWKETKCAQYRRCQ